MFMDRVVPPACLHGQAFRRLTLCACPPMILQTLRPAGPGEDEDVQQNIQEV